MRVGDFLLQGFEKISPKLEPALATPYNDAMLFLTKKLEHNSNDKVEKYIYVAVDGEKSSMGIINVGETSGSREEIMKLNIE